jgi:histidinol-phosphate phosphatase family protein
MISAVFLDRDGVFNPHIPNGYLLNARDLVVIPGVPRAVRLLNDAGVRVIVISNQQGVGKGLMTMDDLAAIDVRLAEILAREAGARLDGTYYCTDLAGSGSPRRKPEPGMLFQAARDFNLRIDETVFAGDSVSDIKAGRAAGVMATVLLLSGGATAEDAAEMNPAPDRVFRDLGDLVDWVLEMRQ